MDAGLVEELSTVVARQLPCGVRAREAADLIRYATSARWVGIYSVTDTHVENEAWSGPSAPAHPVFSVGKGLTSHAIRTGRPVVSNDVATDPRYLTNQQDSGAELIVPVLKHGRVVGTLDVEDHRTDAFTADDVARYEQLAQTLTQLW